MNEILKCVEMLRELLREQIQRNTDLHLMVSQQLADVNEARRERDAAWDELSALKSELDRVRQLNQQADKSSVGDSTYVLTQPPCQRISWVGTGTDWHAEGYKDGRSIALSPGGTRGAKWHADGKALQGWAAVDYIAGFNKALDEHEQEEAK